MSRSTWFVSTRTLVKRSFGGSRLLLVRSKLFSNLRSVPKRFGSIAMFHVLRLRWRLVIDKRRCWWPKDRQYSGRRGNVVAHSDQRSAGDADTGTRQRPNNKRIGKAPYRINHQADRAGGRERHSVGRDKRRNDKDDGAGVWWSRRTRTNHNHCSDADRWTWHFPPMLVKTT